MEHAMNTVLSGYLQEPHNHQEVQAGPAAAPLQSEASGLGRTASTGGGATAALLQPAGHTHTDLLATPQDARPSPGSRFTATSFGDRSKLLQHCC